MRFLEQAGYFFHFAVRALGAALLAVGRPRDLLVQLHSVLLGALPLGVMPLARPLSSNPLYASNAWMEMARRSRPCSRSFTAVWLSTLAMVLARLLYS